MPKEVSDAMKSSFAIILIFLSMAGCTENKTENRGRLLAKVGKDALYESDLKLDAGNSEDSSGISRKLLHEWLKNELIYNKAMAELTSEEKNKDKELNNYYQSLIRYQYLEKMVKDKIDTNISDQDIALYYQNNQKNFELKRNIIRFLYVKVPREAPLDNQVKSWIRNPSLKTIDSLKTYVRRYARNSLLDTGRWYYFSDITKEIPILQDYSPEHFIRTNNFLELKDARFTYLLNIVDGKIKDEIAPIALVKDKIRTIIINRNKTEQEKLIENQIFREGENQHLFEIYGLK